jgi:colanic acid/amylovoran biosynthesis glycosyltransferase
MLEAMASGLPAFATAHGGIPEAIEDGVSGALVSEGDDAALSRALLAAAEQRDVLTKLAERGAATVSEKFEQAAQVRKLEDYYFEAMGDLTPRGIPI